jgi:hypothetical protein
MACFVFSSYIRSIIAIHRCSKSLWMNLRQFKGKVRHHYDWTSYPKLSTRLYGEVMWSKLSALQIPGYTRRYMYLRGLNISSTLNTTYACMMYIPDDQSNS